MRIRCRSNLGADIVEPYLSAYHHKPVVGRINVTPGRVYTVYALGLTRHGLWVYIADDTFTDGPRRHPLCLFDVVDSAVSRHWRLAVGRADAEESDILAPAAWVELDWFFNGVVDGEATAVAAFAAMKQTLDEEADDDGPLAVGEP